MIPRTALRSATKVSPALTAKMGLAGYTCRKGIHDRIRVNRPYLSSSLPLDALLFLLPVSSDVVHSLYHQPSCRNLESGLRRIRLGISMFRGNITGEPRQRGVGATSRLVRPLGLALNYERRFSKETPTCAHHHMDA